MAKDSTDFYQRIAEYSKKRKFTKTVHHLIFRSTTKKQEKTIAKKITRNYDTLEGKIIRNIIIETKDPFGFSFTDSTKYAHTWVEKTGNQIHIKSKEFAIRNFLLLKEKTPLDTLLLDESARLIRSQNFIREVEITAHRISKDSDSVDVLVTALDSWSLIPKGTFSTSKNRVKLKERNFIGTGHQLIFSFANRLSDGKNAYEAEYRVPNFKNTFVSAAVRYKIDLNGFYIKSANVQREFYSPFARWAGGLYIDEQYKREDFPDTTSLYIEQDFKYISQDYWGGHSFKIFKGNTQQERSTSLITSIGYRHIDYRNSPSRAYDSIGFFSNETFYLTSIGIASRQFVKDKYIFNDGVTEDVPTGTIYSLTGGVQHKYRKNRLYLGARGSYGSYYDWGYMSANFEIGSFFNGNKTEQTAFSFQANYFTHLVRLGDKWKMRQFVKPQFIIGINRLNSIGDRLTIDGGTRFSGLYGSDYDRHNKARIPGFDSELLGTEKYLLALQTQFYSPWEVLGFRLNPYLNFMGAMLNDGSINFKNSKLYSSFGVGFIIRNDYLVFSNFQVSFSYYPQIPGQGNNIFKTNSFETDDFGFQDFQLGKPRTILYN